LPREETTPPVMKMNRVMDLQFIASLAAIPRQSRAGPTQVIAFLILSTD
jgi:hypothetical protein